jgi:hypothetical protein
MELREGETVVRAGTYLYDGTVLGDLRIVRTNVRFGSGDHLDEPEVREDQPGTWFDVQNTLAGERGQFKSGILGFGTIEEALGWIEGKFAGVVWGG